MRSSFLFLLSILWSISVFSQSTKATRNAKGTLFIIGGGRISDSLRSEMIRSAGWKKGDGI
ncbi:MAG TPA: hypothetical protein VF476_15170, partial [Chitinophagaceae bacterium]